MKIRTIAEKGYRSFILFLMLSLGSCEDEAERKTVNEMYFPPSGANWETTSPATLGWNESAIPDLVSFLSASNTRAFIVLKDGRIVIEQYMGKQFDGTTDFGAASNWYWASAGKTLTAAAVGIAESKGQINLNSKVSDYLGTGWTSLSLAQENKITVSQQLAMTTGLDDGVPNRDCTLKACLQFKAEPGTRWAYHNAPYTLLDKVIASATNKTLNAFIDDEIEAKTGMDGQFIITGDNNVFYSTARSMARFGLLLLNSGKWNETVVIPENYVAKMYSPSQDLNQSYGLLTWLNGKSSFMVPTLQTVFSGSLTPAAPASMYAAMGKNGQLINIVPELNLVMIRMGDAPDNTLVPITYQDDLWKKLNNVIQ